jgi:hypothetical protein
LHVPQTARAAGPSVRAVVLKRHEVETFRRGAFDRSPAFAGSTTAPVSLPLTRSSEIIIGVNLRADQRRTLSTTDQGGHLVYRFAAAAAAAALIAAPAGTAQAPSVEVLHVNDAAVLAGANVRCVAKAPSLLMCGAANSKIYVQITRGSVDVFKAVGPSAIFRKIQHVQR